MEIDNPLHRPITMGTIAISTGVSIYWWLGHDVSRLFMEDSAVGAEPWRLLTSTLLHADFIHLIFNALWMFRFGMLLEGRLGGARFGALFLLLAVGSGAAERAFFDGGVGLSGVVYGLFGWLWAARRCGRRYAEAAVDSRTTGLFVAWFFFCIVATYTEVMNIANVAHGMGGVLGVLAGYAAYKPRARIAASVGTGLLVAASLAGAGPLRSQLSFARAEPATPDEGRLADRAIDDGDYEEAVTLYRTALEKRPDDWRLWYNLYVAHSRLDQHDEGIVAATKAHELEASEQTRRALGRAHAAKGYQLMLERQFEDAVDVFREAESIVPDNAGYKHNLSICLANLGRGEEAEAKRRDAAALEADAGTE